MKANAGKSEVTVRSRMWKDVQVMNMRGKFKQIEKYKYLRSTVAESGGREVVVDGRIKAGRRKGGEVSEVVYYKRMPKRLKAKVHKIIRAVMIIYGAVLLAMKTTGEYKQDENIETGIGYIF